MRKAGLLIAVLGTVLYWAPSAQAFECGTTLDQFTRANGTFIGPNWTEQAPDPAILGGTFTVAAAQPGLASYNTVESTSACADVQPGAGLSYAAIVLGYANLANNVFVKVQGGGSFSTVFFYKGNNGSTAVVGSQAIPAFNSGRLYVSLQGTTVTAEIDTNFDNQPETIRTQTAFPIAGLGNGIGLAAYGGARLDEFSIPTTELEGEGPRFSCRGRTATLVGGVRRDVLTGTRGRDIIVSLSGGDIIRARGGNDLICSGTGRDRVFGGGGRDTVFGGSARDFLFGGGGRDKLYGGSARDKLVGGAANDRLYGGSAKDVLLGRGGRDLLVGGSANDRCNGGPGFDTNRRC